MCGHTHPGGSCNQLLEISEILNNCPRVEQAQLPVKSPRRTGRLSASCKRQSDGDKDNWKLCL